ncbi:MAG: methylmalonyl Co-A mutase-associated GTPase MeaB, partial [Candidatus Krumholzibacteria bacterium]|nr:methylmalonyl Co-A mutase-associated GTPase MeaB [Candidatus Krumholzibacteria bacterium]
MTNTIYDKFHAGDVLSASRLMSRVEGGGPDAEAILDELFPHMGSAYRIGITGGTGSGKSTLIDALVRRYRSEGTTIGVVAEDPTSPFSGGAVLGDRIRMSSAAGDTGVFIRSIASRGSETGFSVLADELADVLDAFGRDLIFLETIGVGQLEYKIRFSAFTTVVVFTPESGDDVQGLKSGLMEVGDIFVVNKSDRPRADQFVADLRGSLDIRYHGAEWEPPVVPTVARGGAGVNNLEEAITAHRRYLEAAGALDERKREGLRNRVRYLAEDKISRRIWGNPYIQKRFDGIVKQVVSDGLSPYEAAKRLVEML